MGYYEIVVKLREMAAVHGRFSADVYGGVIDAIMGRYMTVSGFYEGDCIRVFEQFLSTNCLSW